jgi:hypothetical protein
METSSLSNRPALRRLVGAALVAHGLAHTSAGFWASTAAPAAMVTILWSAATVGFLVLGLLVWEGRRWSRAQRVIGIAAAVASAGLLLLAWHSIFLLGLSLDVLVVLVVLRSWRIGADRETTSNGARPRSVMSRLFGILRIGFVGYVGLVLVTRPWHSRWGTAADERELPLPGDQKVPLARYRIDHAVTIKAPADSVWPWLVQLGQDRAGFYSYDWLERLVGDDVHNADRIVPAWQRREVGDLVRATQPDYLGGVFGDSLGWRITEIVPGRAMVLEIWGAFVVRPIDAGNSRLYVRLRGSGVPSLAAIPFAPFGLLVFEPVHFVMERGMLLGIKARAERRAI